jgi:hypothetical protein
MDTQTVLEIIKMLDTRINFLEDVLDATGDFGALEAKNELEIFQYHLQEYIENQISHMETEQGM